MAEDVATTVARLKARCEQARDARIRAEHAHEQAHLQVVAAAAALKAEFGVETPEQAAALLADIDKQIADETAKIEQALG